jgi:hypothetical protein
VKQLEAAPKNYYFSQKQHCSKSKIHKPQALRKPNQCQQTKPDANGKHREKSIHTHC